jgi:hypothetical protein
MFAATGASESSDPVEAGRAAAAAAMTGLARAAGEVTCRPDLIIVYVSVRYDLPLLLAAIRSVTGDVPLVGATSAGHFRDGTLTEPARGVAVLALTAGDYRFAVASVGDLSAGAETAGMALARQARAAIGERRTPFATMLLLADGMATEVEQLLAGIHRVTGTAVQVVGGGAGDDHRLRETFVLCDDSVLPDSAVAVWIDSEHPLPVTIGHGWHPVGQPMLVTRSDGQIVYEISGRPAREVFEEQIAADVGGDLDTVTMSRQYCTHAWGIIESNGSYRIRGTFPDGDGRMRTFAPLREYSAVQVVACDEEDLLRVSREVAARAVGHVVDRPEPSVLLVFSCVARLDVLAADEEVRPEEEAARIGAAAGIPVFGIYTYGEFARTNSVAGYHNSTIVAVAL